MTTTAAHETTTCEWCAIHTGDHTATHMVRNIPTCAAGVAWYTKTNPSRVELDIRPL